MSDRQFRKRESENTLQELVKRARSARLNIFSSSESYGTHDYYRKPVEVRKCFTKREADYRG
jgi:hypothetical protein